MESKKLVSIIKKTDDYQQLSSIYKLNAKLSVKEEVELYIKEHNIDHRIIFFKNLYNMYKINLAFMRNQILNSKGSQSITNSISTSSIQKSASH